MAPTSVAHLRAIFPLLVLFALLAACGDDSAAADAAPIDAAPDAATVCPSPPPPASACDFFLGCGCADDEKCTVLAENTRGCLSAGASAAADPCLVDSDCQAGLFCANYGSGFVCMTFCDASHPCREDQACHIGVAGGTASLCGALCDLRQQTCAAPTHGCYPAQNASAEKGLCSPAGDGEQGAACDSANDCAQGLTCLTDGRCHTLCDRTNPSCPSGSCQPLPGHTATGICR